MTTGAKSSPAPQSRRATRRLSALSAGVADTRIVATKAAQLPVRNARGFYPFGAPEYVDLELYLMWRARGMQVKRGGEALVRRLKFLHHCRESASGFQIEKRH